MMPYGLFSEARGWVSGRCEATQVAPTLDRGLGDRPGDPEPAGQPEGPPSCRQGMSGCVTTVTA